MHVFALFLYYNTIRKGVGEFGWQPMQPLPVSAVGASPSQAAEEPVADSSMQPCSVTPHGCGWCCQLPYANPMEILHSAMLRAGQTPQGGVGWCPATSRASAAAPASTDDAPISYGCASVLGCRKGRWSEIVLVQGKRQNTMNHIQSAETSKW